MKRTVKTSRTAGALEKMFRELNKDFFNNELDTPIITITPTPRAYGHYTLSNRWDVSGEGKREINIASGTLNRPIENVCATLVHEMVHMYNDTVLNVQDCSRGGTYHNKKFKEVAESHGLIVSNDPKYGWSHTEPSEELILWLCEHDYTDIEMNRPDYEFISVGVGTVGGKTTTPPKKPSHHRTLKCPCCNTAVRVTKQNANIICGDCMMKMVER